MSNFHLPIYSDEFSGPRKFPRNFAPTRLANIRNSKVTRQTDWSHLKRWNGSKIWIPNAVETLNKQMLFQDEVVIRKGSMVRICANGIKFNYLNLVN